MYSPTPPAGACGKGSCDNHLSTFTVGPGGCQGSSSCDNKHGKMSDAKAAFLENGGVCSSPYKVPEYDIPSDVCVGKHMCDNCQYYLGCLEAGRCNEDRSPSDILINSERPLGLDESLEARCKLCHVRTSLSRASYAYTYEYILFSTNPISPFISSVNIVWCRCILGC